MVTTRIHETENIDQIMLEASQDVYSLFNADRLTLYAVSADGCLRRVTAMAGRLDRALRR